jgi:hypothetical protein
LLGPEWENIIDFFDRYSLVAVAALAIILAWWVLHRLKEMGKLPSTKKGDEGV